SWCQIARPRSGQSFFRHRQSRRNRNDSVDRSRSRFRNTGIHGPRTARWQTRRRTFRYLRAWSGVIRDGYRQARRSRTRSSEPRHAECYRPKVHGRRSGRALPVGGRIERRARTVLGKTSGAKYAMFVVGVAAAIVVAALLLLPRAPLLTDQDVL